MGSGGGGIGRAATGFVSGGISETGNVIHSLLGDGGANAAQQAALAQQRQAQKNYNNVSNIGQQMTTQGLLNYDKALGAQDRQISRQEEMVKQIDPTVLEASNQALKLLRGESSSTLAPIQNQRGQQRQKLLDTLRSQLGPGAETSTAGIQALTRFDSETNNLLSGQQQSALQGLGNTFNQFSGYGQQLNQSIGQYGQLTGARAGLQGNYASLLNSAANPLQQTAGAQFTADTLKGQQQYALGTQLLGAAVTGGAGALKGGA